MALIEVAEGRSALSYIETLNLLSEQVGDIQPARENYDDFLGAMKTWAQQIDQFQVDKQKKTLTNASSELERRIDTLTGQCESAGWTFKSNWR